MVIGQRWSTFPNFVQSYYINLFIFLLFIAYNNLLYFEYAFVIQITVNNIHTFTLPPIDGHENKVLYLFFIWYIISARVLHQFQFRILEAAVSINRIDKWVATPFLLINVNYNFTAINIHN